MIYLDHAATTPVRGEVLEAMTPYLGEEFGNPSGVHALARSARRALDDARERLGDVLGCQPGEIVFTSGGTEADNLAVTGAALGAAERRGQALLCCSGVEHPGVLEPLRHLGGVALPVDRRGVVDLDRLESLLREERERVVLVSIMTANNETGVLEPVAEVGRLVAESAPGALFHTDAVQALGWLDVAQETAPADLVAYSAHKIGGPKGVGALVVRNRARERLSPVLRGGPQERELRAGTENVAGIVGFARAAELALAERAETSLRVAELSARLLEGILEAVADARPALEEGERLGSIVNVGVPGVEAEELLLLLDQAGVAASAGAACASGALDPSPVLLAMGIPPAEARGHVRFSLGRSTTCDEVDAAVAAFAGAVDKLRAGL